MARERADREPHRVAVCEQIVQAERIYIVMRRRQLPIRRVVNTAEVWLSLVFATVKSAGAPRRGDT